MVCPECGKENQDGAKNCQFCNAPINSTTDSVKPVTIKVSKLAITAIVLALCVLLLNIPAIFAINYPRILRFRTPWVPQAFLLSHLLLVISIILGFVSIVRIEMGGGKITGRKLAITAILLPIFAGLLPVWYVMANQPRSVAFRMVCGTNLSGIGKAMLIYANDYGDEFPRAGGPTSVWANQIPNWKATGQNKAYGLDSEGTGGTASISSSLYLLVKYAEVEPKNFVCEQDKKVSEFKPAKYKVRDRDLIDLWDFGPEPWKHCSYSYNMPYGQYALTTSSEPGLAVAADRNPWIPSLGWKVKDISKFNPDGDRNAIKAGNSFPHKNEGQNVLFIDSHVEFENTPCNGVDEDNIYTYQDGGDIRRGSPPQIGSQPTKRVDSMLVNDPPM